ncbi:hypothetical protein [Promicromonospora iranensis]|uniref:MftR C-terminal domain-containing protein n=1 Tax=Promicromonospora iranensis TaxID=1105144 RepID=A0ABU2CHC6_9MICO|nr:hypothetical protein [Promicromonospora iranensis]MDR7380735.1 hypothetical protein [Promicromonospora iranensis]
MSTEEHIALAGELLGLVERRIIDPLEILFGPDGSDGGEPQAYDVVGPVRERARIEAEVWAAQLLGRDERLAGRTAARLVASLFPADGPFDPPDEWWGTAFGRVVAQRVGHPGRTAVSFAVAGAMLGITRQGVHDLVKRAKLARHPDGGVTTASVQARLNQPKGSHVARDGH